jgi:hypothetical protein
MATLRSVALLSLLALAAALGGCKVDGVNPVVPLASAQADTALYGAWRFREKDELTYVHIGPDFALGDAKEGQPMRIVIVDHKRNGLTEEDYVAYGARAGRHRFLSVAQEEKGRREGYLYVRYALLDGNAIRFATVNQEALGAAIKAGRIKGTVRGEGLSAETVITADPAETAAFLAAAGDDLFNPPVVLRRVPPR